MDCHFEMIDGFPFDMKMILSSRGKDLRPSVYFRNDSHFSYHRRKMLCPVVFTFKRTDHLKKRPYIFGNDSSFRNGRLPPKTLEILSFIKDRSFFKAFALISYLKENHRF